MKASRNFTKRAGALFLAALMIFSLCLSFSVDAYASSITITDLERLLELLGYGQNDDYTDVTGYLGSGEYGGGHSSGGGGGRRGYASGVPQRYYTSPSYTVQDTDGNTTNYYSSGDTTSTTINNPYTNSFNSIHDVGNTGSYNSYSANVDLQNFLNSYTYNSNNYSYTSNDYKSYYYDQSTNNYDFSTTNTYYNNTTNNYLFELTNNYDYNYYVNVTYSPTYVTVNYISNDTTINNVTNIYYYEFTDGRNSSTIINNEINGLNNTFNSGNYDLVIEDDTTLHLQHFDGNYSDSSAYENDYYSVNRSLEFADSGDFGQALVVPSQCRVGAVVPSLVGIERVEFEFRLYTPSMANFRFTWGDLEFIAYGGITDKAPEGYVMGLISSVNTESTSSIFLSSFRSFDQPYYTLSNSIKNTLFLAIPDFSNIFQTSYVSVISGKTVTDWHIPPTNALVGTSGTFPLNNWTTYKFVIDGDSGYVYVNGDLIASKGNLEFPADSDTIYFSGSSTGFILDEFRISIPSGGTPSHYTPPTQPFDTNKVLALPDSPDEGIIYVRSSIPANGHRLGGVRPSSPPTGFVYIGLDDKGCGVAPQIYDGSNWASADAYIYDMETWTNVVGYKFNSVADLDDVDIDDPDNPDPKPTPTPGGSGGDDDDDDGDSIWDKLLKLITIPFKGIGSFIGAVIDSITGVFNLADEFISAFGGMWSFLPPEISSLIVAALGVALIFGIIKLFK